MKRLSTSLLIFILALLAVPDRAWAWSDLRLRSSIYNNWDTGYSSGTPDESSFNKVDNDVNKWTKTIDATSITEDIVFRLYTTDDGGKEVQPSEDNTDITNKGVYSSAEFVQGEGRKSFRLLQSTKHYDTYTIDAEYTDNKWNIKVTATKSGSSDPVSYALVGDFGSPTWEWNDSYVFTKTAENTYSLDIAGSTFSGKSFKLKYKEGTKDGWAAGPATDHLTTLGEAVSFNGDDGQNYVFPNLENKDYVIELTTTAKTAGSFTVKEKTSASETKCTVTISADPTMGTVNPTGEQQIGSTGVEVTATAGEGYTFDRWETTGGAIVTSKTSRTTTVTATSAGTLTATFKPTSTPAPQVEKVKLYVKNAAGWTGDMYAYVFKSSTEHNAAYPGVKMTSVTGNDYDFEYTVPEGYENGYVIFSTASNRFPAENRSGFGIRNASHLYNNKYNTWTAPQASTIEGKNSVTIYAYINNDLAWYPANDGDSNGNIAIGTNFYIFAYTDGTDTYHAYNSITDTKLTTNDYKPDYGKTAGTAFDDYGDYCDETVYPVGYSGNSNLRYAKFVIYYDKELEGQTAFYTLNSGSLGKGQTSYGENYQIRQLFKDGSKNLGDSYKGTPYYYELPSVKLENGTSYSFKLSFANNYMHQTANSRGINYENYRIENASSESVAKDIFPTVTLDDDYGCIKGQDNSNGTFFSDEEKTNIWDKASTYNVNMYRPFYSDGLYETICLPFDVPASEVIEKFGEGTKLFKVTEATEKSITFTEQTGANCYIEAGVPYIILPKLSGVQGSNWAACGENGTVITFAAKEMKCAYNAESLQEALSYTDSENKEQSLTMKGCFIPHLIGEADRFFNTTADNQNVFYQQAYNDRRVIRGTRVFFNDTKDPEVTVSIGGQQVSAKSIILDSEDEPIVTGLYAPETGKIEVLKDTRVFSISGQYVGTSLNGLSKGIYVVNGKKVVIK